MRIKKLFESKDKLKQINRDIADGINSSSSSESSIESGQDKHENRFKVWDKKRMSLFSQLQRSQMVNTLTKELKKRQKNSSISSSKSGTDQEGSI